MSKTTSRRELLAVYVRPHILAILMLGIASGLPLALTLSTLTAWLSDAGIDKKAIGLFAALGIPYSFKFAWAPLIDRLPLPLLTRLFGRRRGWAIVLQVGLAITMAWLAFMDPAVDTWLVALGTLVLATLSASQDIVLDAYRVERAEQEARDNVLKRLAPFKGLDEEAALEKLKKAGYTPRSDYAPQLVSYAYEGLLDKPVDTRPELQ